MCLSIAVGLTSVGRAEENLKGMFNGDPAMKSQTILWTKLSSKRSRQEKWQQGSLESSPEVLETEVQTVFIEYLQLLLGEEMFLKMPSWIWQDLQSSRNWHDPHHTVPWGSCASGRLNCCEMHCKG